MVFDFFKFKNGQKLFKVLFFSFVHWYLNNHFRIASRSATADTFRPFLVLMQKNCPGHKMADHCGHFLIDSRNLSAAHNGRKLTYAEELESKSRSSVQVVAFEASESLLQQQQKNESHLPHLPLRCRLCLWWGLGVTIHQVQAGRLKVE